jgi:hypothetical protein
MPHDIGDCLENLASLMGPTGALTLIFLQLPAIAAPLILYRLKRQGFSNCRAKVGNQGLMIEANR